MESFFNNILTQMGAVGVLITVLIWIINKSSKTQDRIADLHRQERAEWRQMATNHHEEVLSISKSTATALQELKIVIQICSQRTKACDINNLIPVLEQLCDKHT